MSSQLSGFLRAKWDSVPAYLSRYRCRVVQVDGSVRCTVLAIATRLAATRLDVILSHSISYPPPDEVARHRLSQLKARFKQALRINLKPGKSIEKPYEQR